MTLGTRIAVLSEGRLVQFDAPRNIYRAPATGFVAEFIGRPAMNTVDGMVSDSRFVAGDFDLSVEGLAPGPVVFGVRPEHMVILGKPTSDSVAFDVDVVELIEPDTLLYLKKGDVSLVARAMHDLGDIPGGSQVHVEFPLTGVGSGLELLRAPICQDTRPDPRTVGTTR